MDSNLYDTTLSLRENDATETLPPSDSMGHRDLNTIKNKGGPAIPKKLVLPELSQNSTPQSPKEVQPL